MQLKPPKSADELFAMVYQDMRHHLLEAAAAMDRIDRAGGTADPRLVRLREAAKIALGAEGNRAARFLELLSEG